MKTDLKLDVSRETIAKLQQFSDLVIKWTAKINLISKNDAADIWNRHIIDSAQIFLLAPKTGHWVDMGTGGGFPGIVAAIMSNFEGGEHRFTFIESDQRKCAFLRTALRELDLTTTIYTERIEKLEPQHADILTARALADLSDLLHYSDRHLSPGGVAIFPKGENWQAEVSKANDVWSYQYETVKSTTNPAAAVLKIKDIKIV